MVDPRNLEAVDGDMAEVFRSMTGAQRLKIANDMFESARRMIASHLAAEHPDWDEQRLRQETARRLSHGAIPSRCRRPGTEKGERFGAGAVSRRERSSEGGGPLECCD